jgi:hypothetical protein
MRVPRATRHRSVPRSLAAVLTLAIPLGAALAPRDVEACGGFFARSGARPSLAYEQVLILHDPRTGTEHFVREVAFRAGSQPFGFVVPTPSRPEVAKVEKSPFGALRDAFPFRVQLGSLGFGSGHGRLGGAAGVTVLDVAKVGSFTAFVLSADDEKGLAAWLRDNGLVSTKEADAWLAHYVRMRFYYVAMRYDPPPPDAADAGAPSIKAETIRISFASPLPYYPYLEPAHPDLGGDAGATPARLLELWMVTPARVTPIAAKTTDGKTTWLRPMQEGAHADPDGARAKLEAKLPPELAGLLPPGPLVAQTFQDQKYSREGFGDVLFAPEDRAPPDAARDEKLRPLLGILDPALAAERAPR